MIPDLVSIVPIPIDALCDRYMIDIRTGLVYDREKDSEVPSKLDGDRMVLSLTDVNKHRVDAAIEDLLLRAIYGDVRSPSENHVTEIPLDTGLISPELQSLSREKDLLIINGKSYRQWRNSSYYVSTDGSVFSLKLNQWLRINYDAFGTGYVSTKENGTGRTRRIPRLVWETYRAPLDKMATLIPKNGRAWDARVENLEVLTRSEKRAVRHPDRYHRFDEETTDILREDLMSKLSNRAIADKYNLPIDYVWKLRTGRIVPRGLEDVGETMKDRGRDKPLSDETIREIRRRKDIGEKARKISEDLGVGVVTVYQILQGKTYKNVV